MTDPISSTIKKQEKVKRKRTPSLLDRIRKWIRPKRKKRVTR